MVSHPTATADRPGEWPGAAKKRREIERTRWACTALVLAGLAVAGLWPGWLCAFPIGVAILLMSSTLSDEARMEGYSEGYHAHRREALVKEWEAGMAAADPKAKAPNLPGPSPQGLG